MILSNQLGSVTFPINTVNVTGGDVQDELQKKPRAPQNDKLPCAFPKMLPRTHPECFVLHEEPPKNGGTEMVNVAHTIEFDESTQFELDKLNCCQLKNFVHDMK